MSKWTRFFVPEGEVIESHLARVRAQKTAHFGCYSLILTEGRPGTTWMRDGADANTCLNRIFQEVAAVNFSGIRGRPVRESYWVLRFHRRNPRLTDTISGHSNRKPSGKSVIAVHQSGAREMPAKSRRQTRDRVRRFREPRKAERGNSHA